jgi:methyltransferase
MTVLDALAHPATALIVVGVTLSGEALLSARHERWLRASGAVEPPDDVYRWMQVVYPAGFLACVVEGWWRAVASPTLAVAGLALFLGGKAIKYAAIGTLGRRWTFRVLPLPNARPVQAGIYRWMRHPNYAGVVAEVLGITLWMRAPLAGLAFLLTFLWILRRRIAVEERALNDAAPSR